MVEMEVSLVGRDGVRGDTVQEPVKLSEEMRNARSGLCAAVAEDLGCPNARLALVVHGRRAIDGVERFELSLGCVTTPALIRALRGLFPRQGRPPFRASLGRFGSLDLENIALADVEAAVATRQTRKDAPGR